MTARSRGSPAGHLVWDHALTTARIDESGLEADVVLRGLSLSWRETMTTVTSWSVPGRLWISVPVAKGSPFAIVSPLAAFGFSRSTPEPEPSGPTGIGICHCGPPLQSAVICLTVARLGTVMWSGRLASTT